MTKTLTIATFLTAMISGGAALASDDCYEPMANWQPHGAVADFAMDAGWLVHRIKIDDGCYEIQAVDAEGRQIEITLNPATLEILDFEYEDHHDDDDQSHGSSHDGEGDTHD